jgi:hypothetical protein
VAIEYNAMVGPELRRTIAYEPFFKWRGTDYYGAGLRALAELGDSKGYELVYCESCGINAFFVARSALPGDYGAKSLAEIYRPPNYYNLGLRHPPDPDRTLIDPITGHP